MEVFDGFIAAIASDFKIKFLKDKEGTYTANIEFENGRSQQILVTLSKDESGDRLIHYFSVIGKVKKDSKGIYKYALELNSNLDYGAIVLLEGNFLLKESILLHNCEPQRFMKSLVYIAAKADELEEILTQKDDN